MVAKRRSPRSRSCIIRESEVRRSSATSANWWGVRLKKAISLAEARALHKSNKILDASVTHAQVEGVVVVIWNARFKSMRDNIQYADGSSVW